MCVHVCVFVRVCVCVCAFKYVRVYIFMHVYTLYVAHVTCECMRAMTAKSDTQSDRCYKTTLLKGKS